MSMQAPLIPESESGHSEPTFEEAFDAVEQSANAAVKAGGAIVSAARQLQKAAQEGDIGKIRRATERLSSVTSAARQDIANAQSVWPFSEAEEREYLANGYAVELTAHAGREGLNIYERDARLLAYPSVLQVLPNDLAVRIDRKRITAIRPRHLVRVLKINQTKKPRFSAERFVEALFSAYKTIEPDWADGPTAKLSKVYDAMTLLPGSASDYSKADFARDIFMVDQSGVMQTRSGQRLTLPASTGTRGGKSDLFTFVAPSGEIVTYYGIRFTEG